MKMPITFQKQDSDFLLVFRGDFINFEISSALNDFIKSLPENAKIKTISFNTEKLSDWDSSFVSFLYQVLLIIKEKKLGYSLENLPDNLKHLLELSFERALIPPSAKPQQSDWLEKIGDWALRVLSALKKGMSFIDETYFSFIRLLLKKAVLRKEDFLFALDDCGPKAIGIVSLISFMVGLILAFVGALQLKTFGAQIYVASLVTIGMVRIMGAIMVGIIMAGRTGASFAATIGTMQVNEEVDALRTMGIPVSDFLVLPRISALVIAMPILTCLADFMGILGGASVGILLLDITPSEFWLYAWKAFNLTNFWVGVFHGVVFGIIISLCGCYYGINCGRNADSVGVATTKAVVSAIVWMIVITGIITVILKEFNI